MDFYKDCPIENFSKNQINAIKGILILCIVFGHLRPLSGENFAAFQFVYNFHVISFLLLPFLYPVKKLDLKQIKTWAVRFYIPFTFFFVIYSSLNFLFLSSADGDTFKVLLKGYFIASPKMIDGASGGQILWFLPHIFAVMIMVSLFLDKLKIPILIIIPLLFLIHGAAGLIPRDLGFYSPFTAVNILYLLWLGFMLRLFVILLKDKTPIYGMLFLSIFIFLQYLSIHNEMFLGYTGLWLPDFSEPLRLILIASLVLSGVLALLYSKALEKISALVFLGKHSLIIFLIHQPFLFITWKICIKVLGKVENMSDIISYGALSFAISIISSVIAIIVINKLPRLKSFIFPRSIGDLNIKA